MNLVEMMTDVFVFWWVFFPSYQPLPYEYFERPGVQTVGLVRDESRDRWWANDMENRKIRYFDDDTMEWKTALDWNEEDIGSGEPGPIALAGNSLYVVMEEDTTGSIRRYDIRGNSLSEEFSRIEIPPSARRRDPSITGLTFDGEYLWLVTDCGLCSVLIQFDPTTGEELYDFFPACAARGITYRRPLPFSSGTLWMVAYNGSTKRPLLTRRKITGDPSVVNTSREYFNFGHQDGPPKEPTAVAVRGQYFWVADRDSGLIKRYSAADLR